MESRLYAHRGIFASTSRCLTIGKTPSGREREDTIMSDTTTARAESAVRPFRIEVPQGEIDELRRRIDATRWPTGELVTDRSQGVQLAAIQSLARYWTTENDGLDIHFIHVESAHRDALPLIMTHGWPGSVIELLETIGPLTDPTAHGGRAEDAFHLVLPSIPGYGFSG